jgi:putative nucleotidyltransferase with HDIG domain
LADLRSFCVTSSITDLCAAYNYAVEGARPNGISTLRGYLATISVGGAAVVVASVVSLSRDPVDATWLILAALTIVTSWAKLRMPGVTASFSISDTFTMTAALLHGPAAGAAIVSLDGLVISAGLVKDGEWPRKALFNATAPALAMWLAAWFFFAVTGRPPLSDALPPLGEFVLPLALFATAYFLLSTGIVAVAIALDQRAPLRQVWTEHFSLLWPTYFGGASIAAIIVYMAPALGPDLQSVALALVLPLIVILYVTFKGAIARVHERVNYLAEVNRTYLAVINALAQAIDAKDQITHGHIRRVQQYAVRLAKRLGVTNGREIQAIEAGALLHDVGKLAIPEHILNKPAKLTPAEFNRMKRHAEIGAQILSSIDFPYPVVPIVRHHHERWDGGGYPQGLAGEDIPLGARILSVVDCFDALRSDRPYRGRLSDEEITAILRSRSGTMYDPNVVDEFLGTLDDIIAEEMSEPEVPPQPLELAHDEPVMVDESAVPASLAERAAVLLELGAALASDQQDPQATCAQVQALLGRIMPAATCVVFGYEHETDELRPRAVAGAHANGLYSLRILNGDRLTGWVTAYRRPIVNSDAGLDLADTPAARADPPFYKCIAVPIVREGTVHGALTVYSVGTAEFTTEDASAVQAVAEQIEMDSAG